MHRSATLATLLIICLVMLLSTTVYSAVPRLMNYQGRVTDTTGIPLGLKHDTTVAITFSLYAQPDDPIPIWSELHSSVIARIGLFNVVLGSTTALADSVFRGPSLWLGLAVDGQTEQIPRSQLVTAGYAFHAAYADSAPNTNPWSVSGDNVYRENGNVGIGTANPDQKMSLNGMLGIYPAPWIQPASRGMFLYHNGTVASIYAYKYPGPGGDPVEFGGERFNFITYGSGGMESSRLFIDNSGNVGIGTTTPEFPLHIFRSTDAMTNPQTVLQLHSASTGDYDGIYSHFGPQISFRGEDSNPNDFDDREFARIAGTLLDDNYGILRFYVMANGTMQQFMTLSDPGPFDGATPAGVMINDPTTNRGVINVRNYHANKYVAYLESASDHEGNLLMAYPGNAEPAALFLDMRINTSTTPDAKFKFRCDGNAYADGSFTGGGADYAEWFEKEEDIPPATLVGLNRETGRARVWRAGDPLIGAQSTSPGFVGNNILGAEGTSEELQKDHVLVALIGQVEIRCADIVEKGREVSTPDGQFIGWRLSSGKVYTGFSSSGATATNPIIKQQSQKIEQLGARVAQLEALVETILAQKSGSTEHNTTFGMTKSVSGK